MITIRCISSRGTGCVTPRRNPSISVCKYRPAIYVVTKRKRKPGYYWKFLENVGTTRFSKKLAASDAQSLASNDIPYMSHVRHAKPVTIS